MNDKSNSGLPLSNMRGWELIVKQLPRRCAIVMAIPIGIITYSVEEYIK